MKIKGDSLKKAIELIKTKTPYRKILLLVPDIRSLSMLNRIKKKYIYNEKPSKKQLSTKTKHKIQLAAIERRAIEKSDLILNGYVDVLKAFTYSIKNLDEIQLLHKAGTDNIYILLHEIVNRLDRFFKLGTIDETEQLNIRSIMLNASKKISDVHKNSLLRIKAIDAIRGQVDSLLKFKIEVQGIEQINFLIVAFLKGTEVLTDEQYFKYKAAVINHNEFARVFFDRWDSGVHQSDLSETEEPDEEKMGDGSKHNN